MRTILYVIAGFTLIFLVLPIFIVIPLSFSASPYLEFPPAGFSLRWYARYFASARWMAATALSAEIALGTTVVALSIGIPAAFGLVRRHFRAKVRSWRFSCRRSSCRTSSRPSPSTFLFARFGLIGNPLGLLIAHTLSPCRRWW
jgi:ABC-type glycerol-3-phosphate transport system permease component